MRLWFFLPIVAILFSSCPQKAGVTGTVHPGPQFLSLANQAEFVPGQALVKYKPNTASRTRSGTNLAGDLNVLEMPNLRTRGGGSVRGSERLAFRHSSGLMV